MEILLGCIADDFTGASDAASFLVAGGLRTILFNGIPSLENNTLHDVDAVVIALKTRTEETTLAVKESLKAVDWLKSKGAKQIYIKYCSTFDSIPKGNIGPICDSILEKMNIHYTLICPSLPVNKRTVNNGILMVDNVPLAETHMRNHPLTPMWNSYIPELMKEQSKYPCFVLNTNVLQDKFKLDAFINEHIKTQEHFYLIPDYVDDSDAKLIIDRFGDLPLLTGGSGLMMELGKHINTSFKIRSIYSKGIQSKALILSGSCSLATQSQIKYYLMNDGAGVEINPEKLLSGEQTVDSIWAEVNQKNTDDVLIYSAGNTKTDIISKEEHLKRAAILETTLAKLAQIAVKNGYHRIIVAGGETSGAITKALGFNSYFIGESIAPGVPVMIPSHAQNVRLVLKSGNFGQEDFFSQALTLTGGVENER